MRSLINTEMVKAAVVSEYDSMFINAGEEFEQWIWDLAGDPNTGEEA